jgi:serine carboxypeptidase 1
VFSAQAEDFMKPVYDIVDDLLSQNKINVTVYQGQLDLICGTAGTELWMTRLTWPGYSSFIQSSKIPLYPYAGTQNTGGFVKSFGPLSMFYIMDAGHMLPADNGPMALNMMKLITQQPV